MAEKAAKIDVDYGPGDIDGQHCGNCKHFIEPHSCEVVAGKIRSGGWSRLWMPKVSKSAKKDEDEEKDESEEKEEA